MATRKTDKKPSRRSIRDSGARARDAQQEQAEATALKKVAFLAAFARCGRITRASEIVNINPDTHYEWRKTDPEYDKAFATMRERVADLLEDEAIRRAVEGVDRPMIGRIDKDLDGVVVTVKDFSDHLMGILLKGNRPEKYRERFEHSGPGGGPIETYELSDAERADRIAGIFEAARARRVGQAAAGEGEVGTPSWSANRSGE